MTELGAAEQTLVGQTLNGRYRVLSQIGTGGMSAVYRAEHIQLGRPVALKVLNAEMATHPEAMQRFEREALLSAKIQHPHVVSATDSGRLADGSLYLVLELVAGRSLRDVMSGEGRLPVARALAIIGQIADALDAAHRLGIVHRDLKPSNVMLLEQDGQTEFVKVLDFGLARQQGASVPGEALTQSGRIVGTPEYMAPEQARGEEVDERADLYALGVIAYELVAGRPPFHAPELLALLIKHIQEVPPALPTEIPEGVSRFVMALLEKEPDRRPKSARQVSKTSSKLATHLLRPSLPTRSTTPARAPRSLLIYVAIGALLSLAAALGWAWRPSSTASNAPSPETPAVTRAPPPAPVPEPDGSAEIELGIRLINTGQALAGLDALGRALDIRPASSENAELLAAVRRAIEDPTARDRALELTATRLGPPAADLLFDVWNAKSAKTPATRAARKWLDTPSVREKARPAALLALEIREAKTCFSVRALLPRMKEHGDARSLSPLRRYRATNGCGFLGFGDCYRCLRRDDALEKAITLVATRPAPSFSSK